MKVSKQEVKRFAAAKGAQVQVFVRELKERHFDYDFFRMAVLAGKDKDCAYRLFIAGALAFHDHRNEAEAEGFEHDPSPLFQDLQAELEEIWQEQSVEKLLGEIDAARKDDAVKQKRLVRKQEVIEELCRVIDRGGSELPEGIDPEDLPRKKEPKAPAEGEEDDGQEDPTHWSTAKLIAGYNKMRCKLSEEELHEHLVDQVHDAMLAAFWPDPVERHERKVEMLSAPSYKAFEALIANYVRTNKLTRQQAVSIEFANAAHFYISFKRDVTADSLRTSVSKYLTKQGL